jgi:Carboxypeptidase regulatory-like domain
MIKFKFRFGGGFGFALGILTFLFARVPNAWTQISAASINGTVHDTMGAVIPKAQVTLTNLETGVAKHTASNDVGDYSFLYLNPGRYTLEVAKEGFTTNKLVPFDLVVNQTATLNLTLQVGRVTQEIVTSATGVGLESSSTELGAVIESQQIDDLPLNGRNFTELFLLVPGASTVNPAQNSLGGAAKNFSGIQTPESEVIFPSMSGQTNRSNGFWLDGVDDQSSWGNVYAVPPIIDSIQEVKLEDHNDDVEFGGNLGASVNVATKAGTTSFHGDLWEFLRNDIFDARGAFQEFIPKQALRYNMYGATAGGPVRLPHFNGVKNKTFFFFGWQGFAFHQPNLGEFNVPTAANLTGDLSNLLPTYQLYDPYTTRPDPNNPGEYIRDPYPNNQIPQSELNQGMIAYAKAILPAPEDTGIPGINARDTTPNITNQNEYTIRVDHTFSNKDSVWFRYSTIRQTTSNPGGVPIVTLYGEQGNTNWGASWVHLFGQRVVLQSQIGRSTGYYNTNLEYASLPSDFASTVGWSNSVTLQTGDNINLIPAITVSGYFGVSGYDQKNPKLPDLWDYRSTISYQRGRHMLKAGGDLRVLNFGSGLDSPEVNFAVAQTWNPETSQGGNALASFLLGLPDNSQYSSVFSNERPGEELGVFFQDQWKLTSRFTVNLGIRYDHLWKPASGLPGTSGQPGGIDSGSYDFEPGTGTYILQALPPPCTATLTVACLPGGTLPQYVVVSQNGKFFSNEELDIQPRVGLAYRLDPRTAIRAGFGIFFDEFADVQQETNNQSGNWPQNDYHLFYNLNYPTDLGGPGPTTTAQNPFGTATIDPNPFVPGAAAGTADPNIRMPYSQQWNLQIQRELAKNTTLGIGYVGSANPRMHVGGYYNTALTPGSGNPQLRAPFPYAPATYYVRGVGRSDYNGLQTQWLSTTPKIGLTVYANYTYSKSMDEGASGYENFEGWFVQNPYDIKADYSPSAFDLRQIFGSGFTWEVPVGQGKAISTGNRTVDYIIGNWQLNGILNFQSGAYFNIMVSGDVANTGDILYEHANLVGNPYVANPGSYGWFNPKAFAVPATYTYGDYGRDKLRSDSYKEPDFSLFRSFPFGESRRVEFRAEAFDLPNTVVLAAPDSTVQDPDFSLTLGQQNIPRQLQFSLKLYY